MKYSTNTLQCRSTVYYMMLLSLIRSRTDEKSFNRNASQSRQNLMVLLKGQRDLPVYVCLRIDVSRIFDGFNTISAISIEWTGELFRNRPHGGLFDALLNLAKLRAIRGSFTVRHLFAPTKDFSSATLVSLNLKIAIPSATIKTRETKFFQILSRTAITENIVNISISMQEFYDPFKFIF